MPMHGTGRLSEHLRVMCKSHNITKISYVMIVFPSRKEGEIDFYDKCKFP